jgi:DNA repair protein RadC
MKKLNIPQLKISVTKTPGDKIHLKDPHKTYELLKMIFDNDYINWIETAVIICLNRKNEVIGVHKLATGGMAGVIMDKKVIFQILLKSLAQNFILAHNHPSGSLEPSREDLEITKEIAKAGKLLDIKLLDHVIMTDDGYNSLAETNSHLF